MRDSGTLWILVQRMLERPATTEKLEFRAPRPMHSFRLLSSRASCGTVGRPQEAVSLLGV